MKYYVAYSYSIDADDENRSDIRSKIIDFKYCVEEKCDLIYLRAELLNQLKNDDVSDEINEKNLYVLNFYPLKEETEMSDEAIKYLVSFHLSVKGMESGSEVHRIYSKIVSRIAPLVTEGEFISLENKLREDIDNKNSGRWKSTNIAILNYVRLE